jgi:hypothetical protein
LDISPALVGIFFTVDNPISKEPVETQSISSTRTGLSSTAQTFSRLEFDESRGSNRIQITSCGSSRAAVLSSEEEGRFFRFMRELQLEKVEVSSARKGDAAKKEKLRKEGDERYRAELMVIHNARFEMW